MHTRSNMNTQEEADLDDYWREVSEAKPPTNSPKFPILCKLAKTLMVVSHGNADPERGFSLNKNILTDNRSSLSQSSIVGLRTVKDFLIAAGGIENVKITRSMIHHHQQAAKKYREEMESEKKKLEEVEKLRQAQIQRKRNCEDQSRELDSLNKQLREIERRHQCWRKETVG